MSSQTLLIDGEWSSAGSTFDVVDPATLERIGQAADAGEADAARAMQAAATAFDTWRSVDAETRGGYLREAAARIREQVDDLSSQLTRENGKPLVQARGEVKSAAKMLEWAAEEGRRAYGRITPDGPGGPGLVLKAPVGPTLAISPWNYPVSMITRKIGLAVAAGCTVIAKPAEQTPLVATAVMRILHETGLPRGVVQQLTTSRPAELVSSLLADSRLRKVSFTGSTEVGLSLIRSTGTRMRRMSLELGGHAPAIVLDDADLEAAATAVVAGKFTNAGQMCIAINRLYVHIDVRDELVELLRKRVGDIVLGHGQDPATTLGPLIELDALAKVERHVKDAVAHGAAIVSGGSRWSPSDRRLRGAFFEPTILTNVEDDILITREETFGPVLPVLTFTDDHEAVERANSGEYGLAAYVFGRDLSRLWKAMANLEFGVIGVNEAAAIVRPELPFGGMKNSGQEREGGSEGVDAYLETKAIAVKL